MPAQAPEHAEIDRPALVVERHLDAASSELVQVLGAPAQAVDTGLMAQANELLGDQNDLLRRAAVLVETAGDKKHFHPGPPCVQAAARSSRAPGCLNRRARLAGPQLNKRSSAASPGMKGWAPHCGYSGCVNWCHCTRTPARAKASGSRYWRDPPKPASSPSAPTARQRFRIRSDFAPSTPSSELRASGVRISNASRMNSSVARLRSTRRSQRASRIARSAGA